MKHVMLDLEFMGKPPAARIASIGACFFEPTTGAIGDKFYTRVEWADNDDQSLPFDASTVAWWMKQSPEATHEIVADDSRLPLPIALSMFNDFVAPAGKYVAVWGNGDDCDCVIMDAAYKSVSMVTPWEFYMTRDVRTALDMCRTITKQDARKMTPFTGTPHHALDDAVHQAQYTSRAYTLMMGVK